MLDKWQRLNYDKINSAKKSIIWSPLLISKLAFRRASKQYITLHQKRLEHRGAIAIEEPQGIGVYALIKIVK